MTEPQIMTLPEVAQRLGMPYRAAYDLVLSGKLPAERTGRSFLVREEEIEVYLRSQTAQREASSRSERRSRR